jgi:hypothetical protein
LHEFPRLVDENLSRMTIGDARDLIEGLSKNDVLQRHLSFSENRHVERRFFQHADGLIRWVCSPGQQHHAGQFFQHGLGDLLGFRK